MSEVGIEQYPQFGLDYFAFDTNVERLEAVLTILQRERLHSDNLIFCGFNGSSTAHGIYPDRAEMYAVDEARWRKDVEVLGRHGGPLFYALFEEFKDDCIPALGVYDKSQLQPGDDGPQNYKAYPGKSVGDACIAIVYFGNMYWDKDFR